MKPFESYLAEQMQHRYARVVGRGTTALYVALRALEMAHGAANIPHEVILPDVICSVVLDAVLLAGCAPVFAAVTDQRYGLDWADVHSKISPTTRAVIASHVFGFTSAIESQTIPVIEDAVQGLGGFDAGTGKPVGTLGDLSFASFHPTKMIGGQGGVIATDDPALWDAIQRVELDAPVHISAHASQRYHDYARQIAAIRASLIRPFDWHSDNIAQIRRGWQHLPTNVARRNANACYLRDRLTDLPLHLPAIVPSDAIWRYTIAAPTLAHTRWILRHLQLAGLPGSNLYPSLSGIFSADTALQSASFAPRLINLWVDATTAQNDLDKMIAIIHGAPWGSLA